MLKCIFTIVLLKCNRIFDSTNKTNDMETLRTEYYNEIEMLTKKLQSFDTDQYGKSYSNESFNISNRIDEFEELISNTWIK